MNHLEPPDAASLANRGRVVTLGMFIIDHFEVRDEDGNSIPADEPAMGGGGIYAMTAARQFLPPQNVGFIADCGPDFPPSFRTRLESLGEMVWFRDREENTTRALNMYSGKRIGEGHQTFKYISPQKQITPRDYLVDGPFSTPPPEWIHVVCDIDRAEAILQEAESLGYTGQMVWEPLIRTAAVGRRNRYIDLARRFAVFSPNELELQTILEMTETDIETNAKAFADLCGTAGAAPAIVVRAGPLGSYTLSEQWTGWVPAYWREGEQEHVVDVTGGGNAFLGGFLAGMFLTDDLRVASAFAAAAASFAIEQRGLPLLDVVEGQERWNGATAWARLKDILERLH